MFHRSARRFRAYFKKDRGDFAEIQGTEAILCLGLVVGGHESRYLSILTPGIVVFRLPSFNSCVIPKNIYITWKTKNRSECPKWMRSYLDGWVSKNPDYQLHLCDDEDCERLFREERSNVLNELGIDLDEMRSGLLKRVEHSDLWRYLVIYTHGGIYTDADTECIHPCDVWVGKEDRAVIGFEELNCAHPTQYCQWTFAAEARHPFFALLLQRVAESIRACRGTRSIDTLRRTGPIVFTDALIEFIETGGHDFSKIAGTHARVCDGIQLLPREAFRGGHVYHRFAGTWKGWFERPSALWRKYNSGLDLARAGTHQ